MEKTLTKKMTKEQKNNLESMPNVLKIWEEINKIKEAQKVKPKDYPYGLQEEFYNKHQNHLSSLLNNKFKELEFIEKMIDAQNTKYKFKK